MKILQSPIFYHLSTLKGLESIEEKVCDDKAVPTASVNVGHLFWGILPPSLSFDLLISL